DVVAVQRRRLAPDRLAEDREEAAHFVLGTIPVLGRECVDRDDPNAEIGGGSQDLADVLGAGAVAGDSVPAAPGRPTTVAIHDDRDVLGNTFGIAHGVGWWVLGARGRVCGALASWHPKPGT